MLESIQIAVLKLEKNLFTQNSGRSIAVRHGDLTDLNSIYERNTGESGPAMILSIDSTYTGTGIIFDTNEAITSGGAVHVT